MLFVRPTTMADRGVSGAGKALRCLLIAASLIAAAGRGGRGEKMWSAADAIGRVRVGKYADTGSHPPARMADERRGASRAEVLLQASSGDAGGRLEDGWTSSVSPSANDLSRDEGLKGLEGSVGIRGKEGDFLGAVGAAESGREGDISTQSLAWMLNKDLCPSASTDTMRIKPSFRKDSACLCNTSYECPFRNDSFDNFNQQVDCDKHACRLEVRFQEEWGTVCSAGFRNANGPTMCKAFGFNKGGITVRDVGGGKGRVWLEDVACSGSEGDVGDCAHSAWGKTTCLHNEDVGLCCFGEKPDTKPGVRIGPSTYTPCPNAATDDLRLISCSREGCRLEVRHEKEWGTVCDDGFTLETASTVCKLMGFKEGGNFRQMCGAVGLESTCAPNTQGTGKIWLDDVVCYGFERDLEGCRHKPWGKNRCQHKQDVGVCCRGEQGKVENTSQCEGGELDYHFNQDLSSLSGGPDLTALWGGKLQGKDGFGFQEGQGLGVDPHGCIGAEVYTVYMRVKLDDIAGFKSLFRSNGWGKAGLFINNHLMLGPEENEVECEDQIQPGRFYQIVMTRAQDGTVTLYMNGAECASGLPQGGDTFVLNPHSMLFLSDNGLRNGKGIVSRIRVLNRWLNNDEVAKMCGCQLPERVAPCDKLIIVNSYPQGTLFSSVRSGGEEGLGRGHSAGRLNSPQAWSAGSASVGEWMQYDTGDVQSIVGVVTQGRRDRHEWVKEFKVDVSVDGSTWVPVGCGRVFPANSDKNSKVKTLFHEPVKARYLRVYPVTWHTWPSMRAGALTCERPCQGGELDYTMQLALTSRTKGPSLSAYWGEGEYKNLGDKGGIPQYSYEFQSGEGLILNQRSCMHASTAWTLFLDVKLFETQGYRRVLSSEGWGDYGLYVNKYLMLTPRSAHMRCKELVRPNRFYKFVMSRSAAGEVKLYINGDICASGEPPYKNHYQLSENSTVLFRDDSGENTGGQIRDIHMWKRTLNDKEVADVSGCKLTQEGKPCKLKVVFNVPVSKASFSSVRNGDASGTGFAQGRLNSQKAWVPGNSQVGEYMQLDLGVSQSVAGVVTQGRKDADQWVTSFTVSASLDGNDWRSVGCGREFEGNVNNNFKLKNSFTRPVHARFIRIYPVTWHDEPAMRAGLLLCEKPCIAGQLDYHMDNTFGSRSGGPSLDPAWGDGTFETSKAVGEYYSFSGGQGLALDATRCLKNPNKGYTFITRIKLNSVKGTQALLTSHGWDKAGLYMQDSILTLKPDGANMRCDDDALQANKWTYVGMTRSDEGKITLFVNGYPCASNTVPFLDYYSLSPMAIEILRDEYGRNPTGGCSLITLYDRALDGVEVAKACECSLPPLADKKSCPNHVALNVVYAQMLASSVYDDKSIGDGYGRGRLNSRSAWRPKTNGKDQWLQMDSGETQTIAGVVTQGRRDTSEWVQTFKVQVSSDGVLWSFVECGSVYNGNTDKSTKKRVLFRDPVKARFVRIYPQTWNGWPSMRAGVLICEKPCSGGVLEFDLTIGSFLSRTNGPALTSPWGDGYFAGKKGYRFEKGEGFSLDQDEDGCMNHHDLKPTHPNTAYTIMMTVAMDETNRWVRLISSAGWGDAGVYINKHFRFFPPGNNMKCTHVMQPRRVYKLTVSRTSDGLLSLYINGAQCYEGRTMAERSFQLDQHNVGFFHDDGNENSGGYVQDIMMWSKALSPGLIAHKANCNIPPEGKKCPRKIFFRPQDAQIKYSSVFLDDKVGTGNGRGRLNSPQGWIPKNTQSRGEWMQIDTGETQSIAGIVTQGRRDAAQWVTSMSVHVSTDGDTWTPVECGVPFAANDDQNTKKQIYFRNPVRGRFLRLLPDTWYGGIAMRASVMVCERKCKDGILDYELTDSFLSETKGPSLEAPWGEGSFHGAAGYRFDGGKGLVLDQSTCLQSNEEWSILMDFRLDNTVMRTALLRSDGWGEYGLYVSERKLLMMPRAADEICKETLVAGKYYTVMITREKKGELTLYLNGYKCAFGVPPFVKHFLPSPTELKFMRKGDGSGSGGFLKKLKLWDHALGAQEVADLCGCRTPAIGSKCDNTLVMNAPYSMMSFSSTYANSKPSTYLAMGRLASPHAWCAASSQVGQWMLIDTGAVQSIAGVVTQGRRDAQQWVTQYKVMVSQDGIIWDDVQCGETFDANPKDQNQRIKNDFDAPVLARYVKIFPQAWVGFMCTRAGVLLCEEECKGEQLDYKFEDSSLQSATKGPALEAPWGEGIFSSAGYRFAQGAGLILDEGACVRTRDYTIMMRVALDHVHGYRRLISSDGWGDNGLYVRDGKFMLFPKQTDMYCNERMKPGQFYTLAVTRTTLQEVSMYLNGYRCAKGNPEYASAYRLAPHRVQFMRDDGNENTAGTLKRIRLWNRALTPDEIASASGCTPYKNTGSSCARSIRYNAAYKDIKYSSIWSGEPVGVGHGRGRLNSPQAWSALHNRPGEYMQIDSGKIQKIEGIITQGRPQHGQRVTAYRIAVSDDARSWSTLECGRVYKGNSDDTKDEINLFDKPIIARYVRIIVDQWHNHISMRAGLLLCETKCQKSELDYKFTGNFESATQGPSLLASWGAGRFDALRGYVFSPGQGLSLDQESCLSSPKIWSILMDVSLDKVTGWNRLLMSEFWDDYGLYVGDGQYMMFPRSTKLVCKTPIAPNQFYQFGVTREEAGKITLYVNGYKCASGSPALKRRFEIDPKDVTFLRDDGSQNSGGSLKRLRMWGKTLTDGEIMAASGCTAPREAEKRCDKTVTLMSQYKDMKFSGIHANDAKGRGHGTGRLNSKQGWSASRNSAGTEWMQIDTGKVQVIAGVVTQGRRRKNYKGTDLGFFGVHDQWVTKYQVSVSDDGNTWTMVQCGLDFIGNDDNDSRVRRIFDLPVKARYVRIIPTAWVGHITMRGAVLLCAGPCKGNRLDYPLIDSFTSTTEGPALKPLGTGGDFDVSQGKGVYCSAQNGACKCSGVISYCAQGICNEKESRDVLACTDAVFGDPKRGVAKQCFCQAQGYVFEKGSGLEVDEGECLAAPVAYSVLVEAILKNPNKWNRLIGCEAFWRKAGVFVHENRFIMMPEDVEMECTERIESGQLNRFGITRTEAGTFTMYLNGQKCAEGRPKERDGFKIDKCDKLQLFQDEGDKNEAGVARRVAVWARALSDAEMAAEAGCKPAQLAPAAYDCKEKTIRAITYSYMEMSSILSNYQKGQYWGSGMLDANYCWIAGNNLPDEWIQLDAGESSVISGVVTQGRQDAAWWTTSYTVSVSEDKETWLDIECGKRFAGNTDMNTKVENLFLNPVLARYVRISPRTWQGYPSMRAGLITCQTKCSGQHLDYQMRGTLNSGTGGASLLAAWGVNSFFGDRGMQFTAGKGLKLVDEKCLGDGKEWSVLIDVRFDQLGTDTSGLLTSNGWGMDGMVVRDHQFELLPSSLSCPERIRSQFYYKYGMTREPGGKVTIFVNGFPCASGAPVYHSQYTLKPEDVTLLRGEDESKNGRGFVKRVEFWGQALTPAQMATESGCSLPETRGACKRNTVRNVAYKQMKASSVYGNQEIGTGWGRGQLNSPLCWLPSPNFWNFELSRTQWLQMDLGSVDTVAGVVTQGCGNPGYGGWFVKSYNVQVSLDGKAWQQVECGRVFEAGGDATTKNEALFLTPVKARYVRVLPFEFSGTPALRAGVITCEHTCDNKELDYQLVTGFSSATGGPALSVPWGEGSFTNPGSSDGYRIEKGQGLRVDEMVCIQQGTDWSVLLQAQIFNVAGWKALLTTEYWQDFGLYLSEGALTMRPTDLICASEKIRTGYVYQFGLTRSKDDGVVIYLNGNKCAEGKPKSKKGFELLGGKEGELEVMHANMEPEDSSAGRIVRLRVWGRVLDEDEMRKVSGCEGSTGEMQKCDNTIVVNLPYSRFAASTVYGDNKFSDGYECGRAKLNSRSAWCPWHAKTGEFLQLDLGKITKVGGVVTQGRENAHQWVTTYKVKVSNGGTSWKDVECGRIFDANSDHITKVKNTFAAPIKARYVRIYPETWYGWPSMRAGLLTCESKCENKHLDYTLDDTLASNSDGPSLDAPWGFGRFMPGSGYSFGYGEGLRVDESKCITEPKEYSLLVNAQLLNLNAWRAIFSAEGWSSGGLFVHEGHMVLRPSVLACAATILPQYYYNFGMTHKKDNTITLYVDGYKCASGKATANNGFVLNPNDMSFMHSKDKDEMSNGNLKRIQIWGSVLDDDKMAEESGCKLLEEGEGCGDRGAVIRSVAYSKMTASSIWYSWYGYKIGSGWGEGQLNSRAAWISSSWDQNQWLQMDLGDVTTVRGVVTQGAGNGFWGWPYSAYRVTAFRVFASSDGDVWRKVECGRVFDGNQDSNTPLQTEFVRPVKARYIRISPHSWFYGPAMRAAVLLCESKCEKQELDYDLTESLASQTEGPSMEVLGLNGRITSDGYEFAISSGLQVKPQTCIGKGKEYTLLMRIQLKDVKDIKGLITTSTWVGGGGYLDKSPQEKGGYWRLKPSNLVCKSEEIRAGHWYWLGITRSKDGDVALYVNGYRCAYGRPALFGGYLLDGVVEIGRGEETETSSAGFLKRVKLWGRALSTSDVQKITSCAPADVAGGKCDKRVIQGIPYSKFSSSSTYANDKFGGAQEHGRARLNSRSAWSAGQPKKGEYLQMDVGKEQDIYGVVTQGRKNTDQWVETFRVQVSKDGSQWRDVECGRIFTGNEDRESKVRNEFNEPVVARYIRILPETWRTYISMRAAVLVCETKCTKGHLDYQMRGFGSDTGGPALTAPFSEGSFVGKERADGIDFPGNDLGFQDISWDACKKRCEALDACVAYVEFVSRGKGCWLKKGMGHMSLSADRNTIFMTKKPWYAQYAKVGYRADLGEGLVGRITSCVGNGKKYSILLEALVFETSGMRKVISSGAWGDDGAYIVNGKFSMYPTPAGLVCLEEIQKEKVYKFGLTRDEDGKVRLYLDGELCASGKPMYAGGYRLDSDDVGVFVDRETTYLSKAYVRRLQIWGNALTQKEMGEQSDCIGPETAGRCPANSLFKPPAGSVKYSGGSGGGEDLGKTDAWQGRQGQARKQEEWMQIDLGKKRQVTSVSIKRHEKKDWQVTRLRVEVSDDGEKWLKVECGRRFKFDFQTEASKIVSAEFDTPVVARYVRLVPLDWVGQPAMRAQVSLCDEEEEKEQGNQEQPAADHPADMGYAGMAALHHSRKEHSRSDQAKMRFAGMANLYRDVFGGPENREENNSRHSRGFSASGRMAAPDSASLYKDPRSWVQSDYVPVTGPSADGSNTGHLLSDIAPDGHKVKSGDAPNSISEMIKRII